MKMKINKKLSHGKILGGAYLLLTAALVLMLLPHAIKYGIGYMLYEKGAEEVLVNDVDFNPFTGVLVLEDLFLKKNNEIPVHISQLYVNMSWYPFFRKRIFVDELRITGSSLLIEKENEDTWSAGGFAIAADNSGRSKDPSSWGIGIGHFKIRSSSIMFRMNDVQALLKIDGLDFNNAKTWEPENDSGLVFSGSLNDSKISIDAVLNHPFSVSPEIKAALSINSLSLSPFTPLLSPYLKSGGGMFNAVLSIEGGGNNNEGYVLTNKGTLSLEMANAKTGDLRVSSRNINWTGNFTYHFKEKKFSLTGSSFMEKIHAVMPEQGLEIFALEKLFVHQANAEGMEMIRISSIESEKLEAVKRVGEDQKGAVTKKPLFEADKVEVSGFEIKDLTDMSINSIELTGARGIVIRERNGKLFLINDIQNVLKKRAVKESEDIKGRPFKMHIAKIDVKGKSSMMLADETVVPAYRLEMSLDNAGVQEIDSSLPDNKSPLTLTGSIGAYTKIQLRGYIQPFHERLTMHLEGKVNELELPPFSPYTAKHIGYNVKSGQMNTEMDLKIISGAIEGSAEMEMKKTSLVPDDENKIKKVVTELTVPLESAISLLRDSDGSIKLKLPVSGDISDPRIGLGDIINKAFLSATKKAVFSYLKHTMQPYGTFITVIKFAGGATRIRLDPVLFEPGSDKINALSDRYLEHVAKLMRERPETQISICGKFVPADRKAIEEMRKTRAGAEDYKPEPPDTEPPQVDIPEHSLSDEEIELARNRMMSIKNILVENYGIDAERLISCRPELDDREDAEARAELMI